MKALVGAFNQEKVLVGAFSVTVQPVVEPMDRFTALIKDCKDVQEEVCRDQVERVCEDTEREQCDILPHEECRQVLETVPRTQAKEVSQVVCDDKEAMTTTEEAASIPDLNTILEIFGVTNKENEVDIDDAFVPSSTTTTTTTEITTTTVSTTTTSTTTTVASTTTVTTTATAKESEFTTSAVEGDGSRIVFDSEAINSRIHHHQDHPGVFPTSTPATTTTRRRQQQPNSLIFFPE